MNRDEHHGVVTDPMRYYETHEELAKNLEGIDTSGMEIEICSIPITHEENPTT